MQLLKKDVNFKPISIDDLTKYSICEASTKGKSIAIIQPQSVIIMTVMLRKVCLGGVRTEPCDSVNLVHLKRKF